MSSVKPSQRPESRFATGDEALKLATYTSDILANENVFDPKFKTTIDEIAYEARMIYHLVRVANDIVVKERGSAEAQARLARQKKALAICEDLRTDIMIAKGLFHLRARRIRYWNKLLKSTEKMIKNWHNGDVARFGL